MTMTTPATWLADRAILRVGGPDARDFLQGLVTNDVAAVAADRTLWSALLTPQGKVLFDFILWARDDAILIDCEASVVESLARRLTLYRLRRAVTIEPTALGVHWSPGDGEGVADPRLAALGRRWLAPPGTPASGWIAHRLRLGVVEGQAELGDGTTLWLECNARELGGVSFTKGCYVGQENTARMNYRSTVNRRLVAVAQGEAGPRTRIAYAPLGLRVDHRRIDDMADVVRPDWLVRALADTSPE